MTDVPTDLGFVLLWGGSELGAPRAPLRAHRLDLRDPEVEEAAHSIRVGRRPKCDGRLIVDRTVVPRSYPTANGDKAVEFIVDPAKIHEVFAADLPEELTPLVAATQRPVAELAFSEPSGAPAWKRLPAMAVIATEDKAAGPDVTRSMAQRAGAKITEVEASHVVMVSQPQAVTDVIMAALAAAPAEASVA